MRRPCMRDVRRHDNAVARTRVPSAELITNCKRAERTRESLPAKDATD
jgi:hypothetical protein